MGTGFWSHVDATGVCWEWTGTLNLGYGSFYQGRGKTRQAHRIAWERLVGPIPRGMVLDHLCRNTRCVNPDHLEVVTLAENKRRGYSKAAMNARKQVCKRGHDLSNPDNLRPRKGRSCRLCHNIDEQARAARKRGSDDISELI